MEKRKNRVRETERERERERERKRQRDREKARITNYIGLAEKKERERDVDRFAGSGIYPERDTAGYPVVTTCYHVVYVPWERERERATGREKERHWYKRKERKGEMQIVLPDLEYTRQRDTAGYPVATTYYPLV